MLASNFYQTLTNFQIIFIAGFVTKLVQNYATFSI